MKPVDWSEVREPTIPEFISVSRETEERLAIYADLVRKWQSSINLISPKTLPDLWTRHILDSLQLFALRREPAVWMDMGSGAGFPGLVTAICLAEAGEGWVHLVESNNKKAAFLRQAISKTGARASVMPVRIDAAARNLPEIEAISARALAPLTDLLSHAAPFAERNPAIQLWFHKGLDYAEEVRSARDLWVFDLVEHKSQFQDGSVILEIGNLKKFN